MMLKKFVKLMANYNRTFYVCYFERVVPKYRKKTHTRHEECKEIKKQIPRQEKSLWVVFLFVFVSVYDCAEHSIIFFMYISILYATRNKIYLQILW